METFEKEELEFRIKAAPLAVGAGAVGLAGVNVNRPGVFGGVLKDRQSLKFIDFCI